MKLYKAIYVDLEEVEHLYYIVALNEMQALGIATQEIESIKSSWELTELKEVEDDYTSIKLISSHKYEELRTYTAIYQPPKARTTLYQIRAKSHKDALDIALKWVDNSLSKEWIIVRWYPSESIRLISES